MGDDMKANILVIEDDLDIQELISEFLKAENYEVDTASDGVEGINKFKNGEYDLIILDLMLPNLDGFSTCKMIRNKSNVPIIILTALNDEKDQLKAFDFNVDDYITKPFSFNILIKRVEAVLRRIKKEEENIIEYGNLKLDYETYKIYENGEELEFTTKEFEILHLLMSNVHKVLTREMLLDRIWGYDFYGENRIVDAHIKNIRKKLKLPYIQTVKGIGYRLELKDEEK